MRIVYLTAAAEPVPEVVVVLVALCRFLRMHPLSTRLRVSSQRARRGRWQARSAAVAYEIPLAEQLDEVVLAVAGDGA